MTNNEAEIIKKKIDEFFSQNKRPIIIKILAWNYTVLMLYCWVFLMLALTIWFFINLAVLHQKTNINIILLIFFLLFLILGIGAIISTKKLVNYYQKKFIKKYQVKLKEWYQTIINNNLSEIFLKKIATKWLVSPNINFYYHPNLNNLDYVLYFENKQKTKINIGTLTQTSNVPVTKKMVSKGFNPYNVNQYQYFLLTVKINSSDSNSFSLLPQEIIKKNHTENIKNFYQTTIIDKNFAEQLLVNIKSTKLIPSIDFQNQILTFCFATILTNNIKDNYDSFFSFNFTFDKKLLYANTIELINKDLTKIKLFLQWLNIIDYIK